MTISANPLSTAKTHDGIMRDLVIQNLKVIKIMKASSWTDKEIADYLGMSIKDFIEIMFGDDYLKEVYEKAQEKLVSDIEKEFIEQVMKKLEDGDTGDAKWVLERTSKKYQKKETVDLNIKSIDDIIRGE